MTATAKTKPTPTDAPTDHPVGAEAAPPTDAAEPVPPPSEAAETDNIELNFSHGLAAFLAANNCSIAFTSYQTGRLYLVGSTADGTLALHMAHYPQAMGVVGDENRIYLGTLTQIVRLENTLGPDQLANGQHDKLYVPRNMQTTGSIDIHELGIRADGKVIFVNTAYSCVCEPSISHSFKPIWKPDFISKLAREDRCHMNGLAMVDGVPKYVSAVCKSDVVDGWRDRRADGGVIIEIATNEIVAEKLSMPHSPREHDGKLWVLNSGSGELGWIDRAKQAFVPFAFFPGFLRGLAFHAGHAFVTLSKPRHGRFAGLALDQKLKDKDADAWCGVQILSLADGTVSHWLRFDGGIAELFDICVLPGVRNPLTLGPQSDDIAGFITIEQPAWT